MVGPFLHQRDGAEHVRGKYAGGEIKKAEIGVISAFLLSIQDSNLDWLIQSQMCYHYTNGQTLIGLLEKMSFISKAGAKVLLFFHMAKKYFVHAPLLLVLQENNFSQFANNTVEKGLFSEPK